MVDMYTKNKEVIGFTGAYSYDLILYLAKALQIYDVQVLVADHNPEETLIRMTAEKECLEKVGSGVRNESRRTDIHCFSGIDIVQESLSQERIASYDCVLIDFGKNGYHMDYAFCTKVFYVGDMCIHTLAAIREAVEVDVTVVKGIILRDLVSCKLTPQYLIRKMQKEYDNTKVWMLPVEKEDFKTRYLMEADERIPCSQGSESMRELIFALMKEVIPTIQQKEYKRRIMKKRKVWERSGGR